MRSAAAVLSTVVAVVVALVGVTMGLAAPASAAGTAYLWRGLGDLESWTDPANWLPNGVPGNGDSATVLAYNDNICHAHVTGVPSGLQLTDLTVDERLFGGNADSPCLTSLDGGSITVTHQFTFHAGTIATPITVAAGATATVTPGAAHDTTHFSGPVTVDGGLTLAANTAPEDLSLTGSPGITVDAGATLTTQGSNDVSADCCNSPAHVTNNGTIQLGAGTLDLGAVELDQNALLNATGGGQVLTTFAPQTAGAGARWTGSGSWQLGYSSITTVSGTQTLSKGFHWRYGGNGSTAEEHLLGTFTLAGNGTFEWGGGAIQAAMTIGATTTFVAKGPEGDDHRLLTGQDGNGHAVALTNRGTATFSGGAGWYGTEGGRFVNAATGTLTLGGGTTIGADCCNTPAAIVNSGGRVAVPAGAGTVTVDNTGYRATGGTLDVGLHSDLELTGGSAGSLSTTTITGAGKVGLAQPVSTTGTETVGDATAATTVTLEKGGAVTTAGQPATTFGGPGTFAWTGGSVTGLLMLNTAGGQSVSGSAATKQILQPTGARPSVVTFAGPTTVLPGTVAAPDTVQTAVNSRIAFTGALSLRANTTFTGGSIAFGGATTVAAGTGSATLSNTTVTNTGDLTVLTGKLVSDRGPTQTAGTTTLAAGATLRITGSSSPLRIQGGTLTGSGTLAGDVTVGSGTVAPGTGGIGTLTVTGSFTDSNRASAVFEVDASGSDRLVVGGNALVAGSQHFVDLPGYQPQTGDVVTIVTAAALSNVPFCADTTGPDAGDQVWQGTIAQTVETLTSEPGTSGSC